MLSDLEISCMYLLTVEITSTLLCGPMVARERSRIACDLSHRVALVAVTLEGLIYQDRNRRSQKHYTICGARPVRFLRHPSFVAPAPSKERSAQVPIQQDCGKPRAAAAGSSVENSYPPVLRRF